MPHTGDLHARTESSGATKPIHEDLIRLTDEINNASEHDAERRTMFHQPTHGAHKDVDHPSQQWGLDWRQYANEAVGIDARHSDLEADAKAIHSAGELRSNMSSFFVQNISFS